ncbi:UNVERIFIED_ORG: hypothetical protein J2X79_004324 [Arthrobacter globiformis]|nr:hypothetical protein [Arthrobacter globiformis]
MTSHEATATQETGANGSRSNSAGRTQKPSWAGVASLSVGVFALVMAEFLPASLLSRVAADLGVAEGVAGQSVAITAIVAAISGITIPVVLASCYRQTGLSPRRLTSGRIDLLKSSRFAKVSGLRFLFRNVWAGRMNRLRRSRLTSPTKAAHVRVCLCVDPVISLLSEPVWNSLIRVVCRSWLFRGRNSHLALTASMQPPG